MKRHQLASIVAFSGLAVMTGCKHHHHGQADGVVDMPITHAPLIYDQSAMVMPPTMLPTATVGMIAGPMPRPYVPMPEVPPADSLKMPEILPNPTPAKIPDAKPINTDTPAAGNNEKPLLVIPTSKKDQSVSAASSSSGPELVGMPATNHRDPFVAAPQRIFTPASTPDIIKAPQDTSAEMKPLQLKAGERFGHATDYRWVAGVLDQHQRGGFWTLRYADFAADDVWGGKVRLIDDARLKEYRNGDYVYIEGDLLAPTSSGADGPAYPPFRISSIRSTIGK